MPTVKELHQVYLSQLDTILKESDLLLQKEGGLDGELKSSGWICEQFIRRTLQKFILPGHFRLTTGFIATPELLRGEKNLPQCDILIVAGNVPPLLRLEDTGIEVVPVQAVCGILEIKRALNKKSLQDPRRGALPHLAAIVESIGETQTLKTDKKLTMANLAVGYHNFSSDKPLLGIIALKNEIEDMGTVRSAINDTDSLVDFVWTLDGHALFPAIQNPGEASFWWYTHTARPETRTWDKLSVSDFQSAESPFYQQFKGQPRWYKLGLPASTAHQQVLFDSTQIFAGVRGILVSMLSRICVRPLSEQQINDYFLRTGGHGFELQ